MNMASDSTCLVEKHTRETPEVIQRWKATQDYEGVVRKLQPS